MHIDDQGSKRLRRTLADPAHAQRVAEIREGMHEMDRSYAMNLAMIRKAAQLTQQDLAARLGKGQAAVSEVERQDDLLLSTLADYIRAAGAQAQLVVTVAGNELHYDLHQLSAAPTVQPHRPSPVAGVGLGWRGWTREKQHAPSSADRPSNLSGHPARRGPTR